MVQHGFGAPFIRLYYNDQEISARVKSLNYTYDEENDDEVTLVVQSENRSEPDEKWCQEGNELKLVWGFIQGPSLGIRSIWIRDLKWTFGAELVVVNITASEKGTTLKNEGSNKVYKGKSLPQVAVDKAEKHGLDVEVHIPDYIKIEVIPGEKLDNTLKRISQAQAEYGRDHPKVYSAAEIKEIFKNVPSHVETSDNYSLAPKLKSSTIFQGGSEMIQAYKNWKSLPQANKSDAQMLKDMARRENNPHTIVETRDNKLIIRRRNFSQKPYRSYEFGGSSGEMQDFSPESKRKMRKGNRDGVGFSGWNPMQKSSFSGTAEIDNDPALGKYGPILRYYKELQEKGFGGSVLGTRKTPIGFIPSRSQLETPRQNFDNTRAIGTYGERKTPYTVNNWVDDFTGFLKNKKQEQKDKVKSMYNSLGLSAPDAYSGAANARSAAELNTNPATAQVWGDPKLQPGMIITVLGVSKKYSGNYYIRKAIHRIDNNGYMVDLEMCRQGNNVQTEGDVENRVLARPTNNQLGDKNSHGNVKVLKTKSDGAQKK